MSLPRVPALCRLQGLRSSSSTRGLQHAAGPSARLATATAMTSPSGWLHWAPASGGGGTTGGRAHYAAVDKKPAHVAVVLSGSGVFDGTEIHEAVSILIHLSKHGAEYTCFAPNTSFPVFNHATDELTKETRNAMEEAARISRGQIRDVEGLVTSEFDAMIIPGGYGAAKNLCNYASKGENCTVRTDLEEAIKEFIDSKKPIGLCCIAPVIVAKLVPGVEVTLGNSTDDASKIAIMGAKHVEKTVDEIHHDPKHNVVTTPAYMYDAKPHQVFDGIGRMVEKVLSLTHHQ